MLRQLSVFIENNQGSLADLTQALESREIIIHSLALADASRFGVVRAIVSQPDQALRFLLRRTRREREHMGDRLRRIAAGKALLYERITGFHICDERIVALFGKGHEHGKHAVLSRSEEAVLLLHAPMDPLSALSFFISAMSSVVSSPFFFMTGICFDLTFCSFFIFSTVARISLLLRSYSLTLSIPKSPFPLLSTAAFTDHRRTLHVQNRYPDCGILVSFRFSVKRSYFLYQSNQKFW